MDDALRNLPLNDPKAIEAAYIYSNLTAQDLEKLPRFNEDGSMAQYQVGEVILGKSALIKFVEQLKK
nr:hypothetical protein [uncultured Flavobacterium sp.]